MSEDSGVPEIIFVVGVIATAIGLFLILKPAVAFLVDAIGEVGLGLVLLAFGLGALWAWWDYEVTTGD